MRPFLQKDGRNADFLLLVRLKIRVSAASATVVIGVDLGESLPFLRQVILREDR